MYKGKKYITEILRKTDKFKKLVQIIWELKEALNQLYTFESAYKIRTWKALDWV